MFVCFDLETTGLSADAGSEVVEFAYILFDNRNYFVKAEQLYFYHKGMNWSDEAYKVHQIPLSFLETQEDKFKGNLAKMYAILNYANVIGHNNTKFDCPFAQKWLARMGLPDLHFGRIQDTMIDFRPVTKRSRIKLTTLSEMRGLTQENISKMETIWFGDTPLPNRPHSGAYDVTATALLALDAIRNGLISFDNKVTSNVLPTTDDINALYETSSKIVDPNRIMIVYNEDGHDNYVYVNHDRTKYTDSEPTYTEVEKCFANKTMIPGKMFPVPGETDVYEYEGNGFKVRYTVGSNPGDTLEVITPYGILKDLDMNMTAFITNNFKGVDYV